MTLWSTSIALIIYILVTRQNSYVKTTNQDEQSQSSEISPDSNGSPPSGPSTDDDPQSPAGQSPTDSSDSSLGATSHLESQPPSSSPEETTEGPLSPNETDESQETGHDQVESAEDSTEVPEDSAQAEDQSPAEDSAEVTESGQQNDEDQTGTDVKSPGSDQESGEEDSTEAPDVSSEQEDQLTPTDSTQVTDTSPEPGESDQQGSTESPSTSTSVHQPPQPQTYVQPSQRSAIELDIGTPRSNKQINRSESAGIVSFFPTDQNVFSTIKEKVGSGCTSSIVNIWEPRTASEYSDKVELNTRDLGKRTLTIHLCNEETKIFVKSTSGPTNEWQEELSQSQTSAPSRMEIKSLDNFQELLTIITYNENLEYDENDTSKYDVDKTNEQIFYKFKDSTKCIELKMKNQTLWKYDPQKDPLYPRSVTFNKRFMGITMRMRDDYLTAFSFGDDFQLNYSGIVKPIEFKKKIKKSTDQWDYVQDGDKGIYTTKNHYAFNKVDLVSDPTKTLDHLLWYPEFETEYAYKVIVDGVGRCKKLKNVTVFQINGHIKHFTDKGTCKKNWVRTPGIITLDIKSTKTTNTYFFDGDKKDCTFTAKLNFRFGSVKKGDSTIWTCPSFHQTSTKVEVENLDKPEIHVTIHLPDNLKKVYILSNGQWVEDLLLILDIGSVKENVDYGVATSGNDKIVTCKSTNRFIKLIERKSRCNCCGSDKVIWEPELPDHYSHKVILDGASFLKSTENAVIYQLNGAIKHYTKTGHCPKIWVEKSISITLDISTKKSTREFMYEGDGIKLTYSRTYNFEFTKIMNKKETVWEPSAGNFCIKVVVENYGKPEVKVTLYISDVITLDYVVSNNQWVQKGSISLDIQQTKGQDYEIQDGGSGAKLYTPNEGHHFNHIRSGQEDIWSSEDSSNSRKVILKGNENAEQHLAIFLEEGIRVYHKLAKGQPWYDITFSRYSLNHLKLFTKDDTGFQKLIPKEEYEMEVSGFSVGYKFITEVKCYEIRYIDEVIWQVSKTYPEGIRLIMDENKIFMMFNGKLEPLTMKVKKPKILDITKNQKTQDYNYGIEGEFGVFTCSEDCVFNGVWSDPIGKKEIWYPETEDEYSDKIKVNKSGIKPDHVMVYLRNGDIKHFTKGDKDQWSEIPTKITLDITKKTTTLEYTYQSSGNSCTFTAKHNFLFTKLVEGTLPIWKSPYSIQISKKVEVKNMGSPDIEVIIHFSEEFKSIFIKKYDEWMERGLLILDIDSKAETIDYQYSLDNNITTYTPKSNNKFMKVIFKKKDTVIWRAKDRDDVSNKIIVRVTSKSGEMMAIVFDFNVLLLYKENKDWSDITKTRYSLEKLKIFRSKPNTNRKFELKTTHYKLECIGFSCGFTFVDKVSCIEIQYDGNRMWTYDFSSPYPKGIYLNLNLNYFFLLYRDDSRQDLKRGITEQIEIDIRCKVGTPQYEYTEDKDSVTSTYEAIGGVAFNKLKEKKGREDYRDVWQPDKENEFIYKILLYGEKMNSLNHIGLYFVGGVIEHYMRVKDGITKKIWVRKENFLEVDISKDKGAIEYYASVDKTNAIVTYTPRFNFKFKTVKTGDHAIWYHDELMYSDIVILKGDKKSEQYLAIILLNDSHKFYHKPAGGEWTDKTAERKSLIYIKMLKKDESGNLVQLKKPSYHLTSSGFTIGYSLRKDIVCDEIQHKGKKIWERRPTDKSPKGINLYLLENCFVIAFESSNLKLEVT